MFQDLNDKFEKSHQNRKLIEFGNVVEKTVEVSKTKAIKKLKVSQRKSPKKIGRKMSYKIRDDPINKSSKEEKNTEK